MNEETPINNMIVKEKIAKEKIAKEKIAKEKIAKEKIAKEKITKEKIVKEKIVKEKIVKEKIVKEKIAKEKKPPVKKYKKELEHDFYILDEIVNFKLKGTTSAYSMVSMNKWSYVSKYDWYLGKAGYPLCYQLGQMTLHRFVYTYILGHNPPKDLYVDHIDRNKLNNTDQNLRLATPQENSFNKTTKSNTKGVKKISENNYSACITKNGTKHEIKNILTEEAAANCYNMMAEELFGEFASFNLIT